MNSHEFINKYTNSFLLLDGATGTNLQAAGMPAGVCPETWILENRSILQDLQRAFYNAGSSVVYAFTFGANSVKLARHGLPASADDVITINRQLADISCEIRDELRANNPQGEYYVAGDLAPTGLFLKPAGELGFDQLVDIYSQQVRGLLAAGVDLFVIETMMDLAQTRAAVIAIRQHCDLPILASVTVEANGRTLSGNSFETCLLTLSALGAQAVGLNCSSGPLAMAENMTAEFRPSDCLLLAKPNAGVPHLDDNGKSIFDLTPELFASQMKNFVTRGFNVIGGCCGTTPEHIRELGKTISDLKTVEIPDKTQNSGVIVTKQAESHTAICSGRNVISITNWRLWPTIICTDLDELIDEIYDCLEDEPEAIIIDLSQFDSIDEQEADSVLSDIQMAASQPLAFISDKRQVQEAICRYYHGLSLIITDQETADLPAIIVRKE